MAYYVRLARPSEYEEIGDLTVQAYQAIEGMMEGDREFYLDDLHDVENRAQSSSVLVAVDEQDRVLASVAFVAETTSEMAEWDEPDVAGFRMLAVRPEAQRLGLGELLTRACIERARKAKKQALVLHTTPDMKVAQHLYEKMGFHRHAKIDIDLGHTTLVGYRLLLA
jgi:ribosomal protein S18 acetylase RimI-like enzyme